MARRISLIGWLFCISAVAGVAHASGETLTFRRATDGHFLAVVDGFSDGPGCAPEYLAAASVDVVDASITITSPEDETGCFMPIGYGPYEVIAELGALTADRYDVVWRQPNMPDLMGVFVRAAVGNLVPNPDFDAGLDGWSAAADGSAFVLDDDSGLPQAPSLHLSDGAVQSSCIAIDDSVPVDLRMLYEMQSGQIVAMIQPYSAPDCTGTLGAIATGTLPGGWQSLSLPDVTLPEGTRAVRIVLSAWSDADGAGSDGRVDHIAFGAAGSVPDGIPFAQDGLTGTWYDPSTSGQGFEFVISNDETRNGAPLFGAWYTYDVAGNPSAQRWYSLQSDRSSAGSFDILRNTNGNFAAPPETTAQHVGHGALAFYSCTSGLLTYAFDNGASGSIPIRRLLPNVECDEDGLPPATAANDFGASGAWYDDATSGQGFVIEVNPENAQVFFGWYTYADGDHGQRWFSGQGPYTVGATSMALTLYTSTGGTFAAPGGVTTSEVGTATLTFTSCAQASLDYAFTAGEMSGRVGTIALTRLGLPPASCAIAR